MLMRVNFFGIEPKSKRGFEKGDMHVVITIESTTIVSLILTFQPNLILMFFHMDSIIKFSSSIQNWRFIVVAIINIGVRGIEDNKGEKQLLIVNGKDEFDQNVFVLGNTFRIDYEKHLEAYNGGHCGMVLVKNVITTKKSIFEGTTLHNFHKGCGQSYSSLSSIVTQQIIKCPIYIQRGKFLPFLLHHFFPNLHIKHQIEPNIHLMINYKILMNWVGHLNLFTT